MNKKVINVFSLYGPTGIKGPTGPPLTNYFPDVVGSTGTIIYKDNNTVLFDQENFYYDPTYTYNGKRVGKFYVKGAIDPSFMNLVSSETDPSEGLANTLWFSEDNVSVNSSEPGVTNQIIYEFSTLYIQFAGDSGCSGASGPTGDTGVVGPLHSSYDNIDGPTGDEGPSETGPTGPIGSVGIIGDTGFTGNEGDTGSTGIQGTTGYTGFTGYTGYRGNTGIIGASGVTGPTGSSSGLIGSNYGNFYYWNGSTYITSTSSLILGTNINKNSSSSDEVNIGNSLGSSSIVSDRNISIGADSGNYSNLTSDATDSITIGFDNSNVKTIGKTISIGLNATTGDYTFNRCVTIGAGPVSTTNEVSTYNGTITLSPNGTAINNREGRASLLIPDIFIRELTSGDRLVHNTATNEVIATASSIIFKENITDFTADTSSLHNLKPKSFHYKEDLKNQKSIGFIAEEVFLVDKNFCKRTYNGDIAAINWDGIIVFCVEEVKKLKKRQDERDLILKEFM